MNLEKPDFRVLFESAPGLYLVLSPSLKIIAVSDAYLKGTMKTRDQILGRSLFEIFPDNPADPAATGVSNLRTSLMRVLLYKKSDVMAIQKHDMQKPEAKGGGFEERYWSSMNCPIIGDDGEIVYIIHKVDDVSEFVRLKKLKRDQQKITSDLQTRFERAEVEVYLRAQEIQTMNRELLSINASLSKKERELSQARDILQTELASGQQDLLSLANEMRLAKEEAQRASKVKSQFLANMSHEIRTPLGVIIGFTDLLMEPSLSWIDRENFLLRIRHSSQHLLDLLNEVLDLTKIEAGHLDIEYNTISISSLLRDLRALLETSARAKKIHLHFVADENVPKSFRSDQTKLRQILINLVSNAIKFCNKGTIELRVEMDFQINPAEIRFLVKDEGPGIDDAYVEHLFEEFSQADSSMTRPHGGSGLGLALSRKLAQALGGELELLHTNPKGSTFCVRLPLAAPTNVFSLPVKSSNEPIRLNEVKILLVDDAPDNLILLRRILEKAGATVETASNGVEGVEKALLGPHDLILMDLQMPKLNGYDATSQLRAKGYTKPIVALTAHAMKEDREKSMLSGCNDYLVKPVVTPLLLQTIQRNLSHPALRVLH